MVRKGLVTVAKPCAEQRKLLHLCNMVNRVNRVYTNCVCMRACACVSILAESIISTMILICVWIFIFPTIPKSNHV